jgi:hypothetical protein
MKKNYSKSIYYYIKNIHYGYDNQYNKKKDNRHTGIRVPLSQDGINGSPSGMFSLLFLMIYI